MTLVMVWAEAPGRWWLISDSRISGSVGTLTDSGAKILEIPATLYPAPPLDVPAGEPFGEPINKTTLGFAYCGSTLVALQAYAAVLPLWSRLQNSPFNELPSVREFADHLAYFVGAYSEEVHGACECVLVGLDHGTGPLDGYIIDAHLADGTPTIRRMDMPEEIPLLGSGAALARVGIDAMKETLGSSRWRREPLTIVRHLISKGPVPTVGGAVQMGVLSSNGFELHFDVSVRSLDDVIPQFLYRGFDMMEVGRVGMCTAIMRGVSG